VTAAEKPVGTFGSSADGRARAMLRLDRAADALAIGDRHDAGEVSCISFLQPCRIQRGKAVKSLPQEVSH
jgi:hypothetical protein